jgi:hypothetical protein
MEDTFDKVKDKAKKVVKKVTDKDTYLGDEGESGKHKGSYKSEGKDGSKEPMNPEDINKQGPNAVRREGDQGIVEERQTDTSSQEAREKYKKKGMTKV